MGTAFDRGLILYRLHRAEQALREFEAELAVEPNSAAAHAMIAICQTSLNRFRLARVSAERAIEADPTYDWGHYALAWTLLNDLKFACARAGEIPSFSLSAAGLPKHRFKLAAQAISEALRLSPRKSDIYALKAAIAFDDMDPRTALTTANEGLAVNPGSAGCQRIRAMVLRDFGDLDGAQAASTQALAIEPLNAASHVGAGWTALLRGRYADARLHFVEALRIDPASKPARAGLLRAMRARYFFYRPVAWIQNWFQTHRSLLRFAKILWYLVIIVCGIVAPPGLGLVFALVLLFLAVFSFANLLLSFDPMGCLLLTRREQRLSVIICSCISCLPAFWLLSFLETRMEWAGDVAVRGGVLMAAFLAPMGVFLLKRRRLYAPDP